MIDVPVLVKDALKEGDMRKEYRISVYDSHGDLEFTITNDNLVSESVTFNEHMCSETKIKFGLCEGSSLEFQYFDYPNITGKRIKAVLRVDYAEGEYDIPIGWFTVMECSRQNSTGIIKAVCYNKLLTDNLDEDIRDDIYAISHLGHKVPVKAILANELNRKNIVSYGWLGMYAYKSDIKIDYYDTLPYYRIVNGQRVYMYRANIEYGRPYDTKADNMYFQAFYISEVINKARRNLLPNIPLDTIYYDEDGNQYTLKDLTSNGSVTGWRYGTTSIESEWTIDLDESPEWQGTPVLLPYEENSTVEILFSIPFYIEGEWTEANKEAVANAVDSIYEIGMMSMSEILWSKDAILIDPLNMPEKITIRDLLSSLLELNCQIGKVNRDNDTLEYFRFNNQRLLPSETLYPSDARQPQSESERADKSMYSKLWADDGNVHKWKDLIITYKSLDDEGNPKESTHRVHINEDGTDNYNMSDNWLLLNTIVSKENIELWATYMREDMISVSWLPFEMWSAGLPYLETGDEIEVTVGDNTYSSYILQRNLTGIQNLQDEYINGSLNIF